MFHWYNSAGITAEQNVAQGHQQRWTSQSFQLFGYNTTVLIKFSKNSAKSGFLAACLSCWSVFSWTHILKDHRQREMGADSVKIQTINMVQEIAPWGWRRKLKKVLWDVHQTWKRIPVFFFFILIFLSDLSVIEFCVLYLKFWWMKLRCHFFLRWPTSFLKVVSIKE